MVYSVAGRKIMIINILETPRHDDGNRQLDPHDKSHIDLVRDEQSESERIVRAVPRAELAVAALRVRAELRRTRG